MTPVINTQPMTRLIIVPPPAFPDNQFQKHLSNQGMGVDRKTCETPSMISCIESPEIWILCLPPIHWTIGTQAMADKIPWGGTTNPIPPP
jgi:hypothetical protein